MSAGLILLLLLMGPSAALRPACWHRRRHDTRAFHYHDLYGAGLAPHAIIHMAVATSLGVIMFTSISSVRAHHQHGAVLWSVAVAGGAGIARGVVRPLDRQATQFGRAGLAVRGIPDYLCYLILFGKKAAACGAGRQRRPICLAAAPCSAPAC
jgi:hypothetical protein